MTSNTQSEIVNDALTNVGAKAAEEGAEAADYQFAARQLDRLAKTWQTQGFHLWTRRYATIFYQPGQRRYVIPSSTDKATEEFVETTLAADATSGATSVTITDSTGFNVGDEFGVVQDSGTINWSTIDTITPTTPPEATVTFPDALTEDAASGNRVYAFTTGLGKILRIPDSRRFQQSSGGTDGQEIPQVQMGRVDYNNLPNKDTSGTPVQFYYNPRIDDGELFVWPVPTNQDQRGNFTYYKPLDTFETSASEADFPNEWTEALVWGLSRRLIAPFGVNDPVLINEIKTNAFEFLEDAKNWDQGDASIFWEYQPFRWGNG